MVSLPTYIPAFPNILFLPISLIAGQTLDDQVASRTSLAIYLIHEIAPYKY